MISHGDNDKEKQMEEKENKKLNVLVFASPSLFGNISEYFRPSESSVLNLVMPVATFDLRTAASYLETMSIDVLIAEPNVNRFNLSDFQSLRQKSERPVLLVGLAFAGPDMELFSHSGLDACYMLPLNQTVMVLPPPKKTLKS